MKQLPTDQLLGVTPPTDGFTKEEKLVLQRLGEATLEQIYAKLPTSRMKAIAAMHFELHYNQELIARIFGVSQEWVSQEIRLIRRVLTNQPDPRSRTGKPYQPRPKPERVSIEQLLRLVVTLLQP